MQQFADATLHPPTESQSAVPTFVHDIPVFHVTAEFANLLTWARSVLERLSHTWKGKQFGLVPSMTASLRARVEPLMDRFRGVAERPLANHQLHSGFVLEPFSGLSVQDGKVFVAVPDSPNDPIPTRRHFDFKTGRDAMTLAEEITSAIEILVRGLIDAFKEQHEQNKAARRACGQIVADD